MQYSREDELPTVMPRILDPNLQFDEQSILKGLQTSKDKYSADKKCYLSDSVVINIPEDPIEKTSVVTVVVKYKYHMLAVLVAIVLIFLAYKLYKYYFTKKPEEEKPAEEPSEEPVLVDAKDSKINYLNNFISDDSEEEDDEPIEVPPTKTKERIVVNKMKVPDPIQEPEEFEFDSQVTEMPGSQLSIDSESESQSQSQNQSSEESESEESEEIDKFLLEDAIDVFNKYK